MFTTSRLLAIIFERPRENKVLADVKSRGNHVALREGEVLILSVAKNKVLAEGEVLILSVAKNKVLAEGEVLTRFGRNWSVVHDPLPILLIEHLPTLCVEDSRLSVGTRFLIGTVGTPCNYSLRS